MQLVGDILKTEILDSDNDGQVKDIIGNHKPFVEQKRRVLMLVSYAIPRVLNMALKTNKSDKNMAYDIVLALPMNRKAVLWDLNKYFL